MRDGVRIAVDLTLPARRAGPVPTILHQTRYMRSIDWRRLLAGRGIERFLDSAGSTRERFVAAGYAWVDVDVRGSGASGGRRPSPWWVDEVADAGELIDWIAGQPWSDGSVGATGVSYAGTGAEMSMINQRPALRAVVPRFSLYDVYADIAFPGGVHLSWFTESWAAVNRALDENAYEQAFARLIGVNAAAFAEVWAQRRAPYSIAARIAAELGRDRFRRHVAAALRLAVRGVTPVDGAGAAALAEAVRDHAGNGDVHAMATQVTFRDDDGVYEEFPSATIDSFSPHAHAAPIAGCGAAVMSYSGWLDGAYNNAAIKRFLDGRADHLLLGPWDHGGRQDISPFSDRRKADYDHDGELVGFFDRHLRGIESVDLPRVRYFTMGAERWNTADSWPPATVEPERWYLDRGGRLAPESPRDDGADPYAIDPGVGTGVRSRWRTLLGLAAPLGYGDRAALAGRMLTYTSAPLPDPLTITGHPIAHLRVDPGASDGALFVYLEDVAPNGRSTYVTEGVLRLLHRAVGEAPCAHAGVPRSFRRADASPVDAGETATARFDLLPVSYRFARGHAIRIAVTGADADHFAPIYRGGETLVVRRGGADPSRIELPVERV
jgi:hypothetical protein